MSQRKSRKRSAESASTKASPIYLIKSWTPEEIGRPGGEEFIGLYSHDPMERQFSVPEFCAAAWEFGAWIEYGEDTTTKFTREIFLRQLHYKFEAVFDRVRVVPSAKAHSLILNTSGNDNVSFVWAEPEEQWKDGATYHFDRHFAWVWYTLANVRRSKIDHLIKKFDEASGSRHPVFVR
jgi:hypothetical protein